MILDVSYHQGKIDWKKVAAAGVTGVVIKATEGVGYVDPRLIENANGAHAAGLKIGYYHFATPNSLTICKDAKAEAEFFIATISKLPLATLTYALDIEKEPIPQITPDMVTLWVHTFFGHLRNAGVTNYCLYSYAPYLDRWLSDGHGLGNVPLWHAGYTKTAKLPKGWTNYFLWQYTDKGRIPGIKGAVDLNRTL